MHNLTQSLAEYVHFFTPVLSYCCLYANQFWGRMLAHYPYSIMRPKHLLVILSFCFITSLVAFKKNQTPAEQAAAYYDLHLSKLLNSIQRFTKTVQTGQPTINLKQAYYQTRNDYKSVELFIDAFAPFTARMINGPDLLRIDEENPGDSIKPHGFQVIESALWALKPDLKKIEVELNLIAATVQKLRTDPDRKYYFTDEKIWTALRLGAYRIISLGITGFDVPISLHALPETRSVIATINTVSLLYKQQLPDTATTKARMLFYNADQYLIKHNDFNTFDRIYFIKNFVNPISVWLTLCAQNLKVINTNERTPLNPLAQYLFAEDIMNRDFFEPNNNYKSTPERTRLGKQLFYDNLLSGDGSRNCGSCHIPSKGFADGLPKPMDITGAKQLLRNTPTLWNTAWQTKQFYDSRTDKLENQLSAVVHNTDEMKGSLRESVQKLEMNAGYASLFAHAYPNSRPNITEYNIANAISCYVRSLISFNSRFDRYMRGQTDSFTKAERAGFNLFMGKAKCGTCHYAPLFNGLTPPLYQDTESEILGVPAINKKITELDKDPGKAGFTKVSLHKYAFKTPSLRNITLTAPYMHNGVFTTLRATIDFYNNGGGAGRGIDLPTQTLPAEKLRLTNKEIDQLISFLETITDTSAVH